MIFTINDLKYDTDKMELVSNKCKWQHEVLLHWNQYRTVDDVNALLLSFSNYVISCMVKYEILKPKNLNSKHHYCNDHIIKLIDKRRAILSNQQYRNSSKGRDELILLINN